MDRTTALTWSSLDVLTKSRMEAIVSVFGSLEEALKNINEEFLRGLGCREETARAILMRLEDFKVDRYEQELKKRNITFLTIEDNEYPEKLKNIPDPPVFLYYRGDLSLLSEPCIAVVGTREMSPYGRRVTQEFVPAFVEAGFVTVSGLAIGVDAEVAKQTLLAKGKTVAVLGHGLSQLYPPVNRALGEQIVDRGGLIISEFPLDLPPGKYTFPARNRIIAGLCLGTVVIEAPEGSGALLTAEFALEQARDVFAVPGAIYDPHYVGCNNLIATGQAKLVMTPNDVLKELGCIVSDSVRTSSFTPKHPVEEKVWKVMTTMPQTASELVEKTKLPSPEISAALTMMELAGAVKNVGNGNWVRR